MIGVILLLVATHSVTESTDRPSIPFSPVPSLPKPVSEARDTSHGLGGFYDLAGGVVNAIRPGELPHDTVARLAAVVIDHLELYWDIPPPETDAQGVVKEFLRWLAPAIAAMVLGLCLACVIPITGCCVLCCRTCGHCGAKSRIYRKKHQNTKCFVYTTSFILTTVMILIGAIISVASVEHTSESLGRIESTVDTALSDFGNYLDGGAKQVNFIADDQFGLLEEYVLNDIKYIGEWFQKNLGTNVQSDANAVVDHASSFLTVLKEVDSLTTSGNTLLEDLRNVTSELVDKVSTLKNDIENLTVICATLGTDECDFLSSLDLSVTVNYTNIGNVEINDEVDLNAVEEQVRNATDMFGDIAHFIDTEAKDYQLLEKAETEFEDAYWTLRYDYLNSINDSISYTTSDGGDIDDVKSKVHDALKYLDTYEPIWDGVSTTLVSLFFLIVVLFAVGAFCGGFGYSRVAQPHSRSSVSNCGGRCILAGVVIAFITSPLLLVVTSISYGLVTGVQKVCEDIQPPDYPVLCEVADDPSVWGGVTLVGVLTRENYYTTVNLSLAKTLRGCAQNEPLWEALDGDRLLSVDIEDAFDCQSLGVGSEDFVPFDGFNTDDIFPSLGDVSDFLGRVRFDEYENISINASILSFNLTELQANLTNINETSVQTLVMKIVKDLNDTEVLVDTLKALEINVEGKITELEVLVNSSQDQLEEFTTLLDSFLDELPDAVNHTTDEYIDRLCGYIDDFITYANDTVRNDMGRCSVLPMAYAAMYSTVCDNALDGLNGYWLGVGWCVLFTMIAVVLGIIVSDYFRKASTRVVVCTDTSTTTLITSEHVSLLPDDDDDNDDVSLIDMKIKQHTHTNKEHGLPEERQPLQTTQMDLEW